MKRVLLLFLVFHLVSAVCFSQDLSSPPGALGVFEGARETNNLYMIWADSAMKEPVHEVAAIFPIGWSEKGAFAFIYQPPTGEGYTRYELNIAAPDQKKLLYSRLLENMGVNAEGDLTGQWNAARDSIQKVLKKFGVRNMAGFNMLQFPIITGKDAQSDKGFIQLNTFNTMLDSGEICLVRYGLNTLAHGNKIIFSDSIKNCTGENFWDFSVAGYLACPDGKAIAVLRTFTTRWSCGGPPSYKHIEVLVTRLDEGFRK